MFIPSAPQNTLADCNDEDMLDDFKDVKIDSKKTSEPEASSAADTKPPPDSAVDPTAANVDEDVLSDDDFAKQLQAGMAELMGEIESSVRPLTTILSLRTGG